jgi:hypothetical protein
MDPIVRLTNPLLPPHPDLLLIRVAIRPISHLHFPDLQLVVPSIRLARKDIKSPPMLGARDPRTERDAKVLYVKETPLREGVGRVRALLHSSEHFALNTIHLDWEGGI